MHLTYIFTDDLKWFDHICLLQEFGDLRRDSSLTGQWSHQRKKVLCEDDQLSNTLTHGIEYESPHWNLFSLRTQKLNILLSIRQIYICSVHPVKHLESEPGQEEDSDGFISLHSFTSSIYSTGSFPQGSVWEYIHKHIHNNMHKTMPELVFWETFVVLCCFAVYLWSPH